jgi:predicted glycosyltransferase
MNVLVDVVHPADVNVFSCTINRLLAEGHKVTCTVLARGRLPEIVKKEFPSCKIIVLGKHRKGVCAKIFGMISRELGFLRVYFSKKFDVVLGFGFYAGIFAWIRGAKAVHMHDDKEYKTMFALSKFFCSRFISFVPTTGKKVRVVKGFKELMYVSPDYVSFDDTVLKRLRVRKGKYVYVREIANVSVNYAGSTRIDYTAAFAWLSKKGYIILFDAEGACSYDNVRMVRGVFSLAEHNSMKKNAALIITSGDTVLREGALLGVPTIYTSARVMEINKVLLEKNLCSVAKDADELLLLTKKLVGKKNLASSFIASCDDANEILYKELMA